MTSLLILPQTKDEQQGFEFGKPRKRKPRRKLSKQEQLRRAIQAHMEEQRQALFAWMNDFQADHPGMLPPMFPGWFHFGLGTLAMSERMTPILQAIWEPAGTRLTARVGLDPDSWSVVNPHTAGKIQGASLAFCKETNDSTSLDLNEALDKLRQELQEGIVTHGESVEQLTKRVQSVFDTATKSRARTIAQTETSRAVHAAQDDAAKSSGVVTGWRWQLSGDACPVCVAIAARKPVTKLGEPFAIIGKNPHYSHIFMPPAHPNCLLPETPVYAPGLFGGVSAHYNGPVFRIRFSDGSDITVTPKHMLLTPTGFAFVESMVQGDDIVFYGITERESACDPDYNRKPSAAKEVVATLAETAGVASGRVPVTPEYLHGDAALCYGDIHVVGANGLLRDGMKIGLDEPIEENQFVRSNVLSMVLATESRTASILRRLRLATDSGVSRRRELQAFRWGLSRGFHKGSLRAATDHYFGFNESIADSSASDPESSGKLKFRLPSNVTTHKIIDIDSFLYHGFVYDLQTESSMYIVGNGIVSSNCNCTAVEIVDTDPQPDYHKHPTLVQPKPSTDAELEQIRTERHQRDEAILRGSEAWGAAPYAERYPGGRPKWFLPTKRYKGFQESEHPRDDHGRWASTGAGHTFGKSKAEVHAGHGPAEIARQQSRTRELLGTTDTNHIASVVGATDDATVMVGGGENENGGELTVRTMHPKYHTERKIRKDSKDRTYIVAAKFDVVKSEQGKGNYGPQVFGRMVEQAAEAKVDRIVTLASRSPNENGYYTWARFGYDAELDLRDKRKLPETMKHATHVSDLMMTPEGRAHWKEHGDTKRMKFDLKPNSRSMKIWRAYLEEKKPTSPTKTWKPQTRRGRHSPKRSKHFIRMDHRS